MSDILLSLQALAREVASQLHRTGTRVVFAESCTAGWCSALLSVVPGISAFLCGSLVTYQNESKAAWLHVSPADLDCPEIGPVSETVARQMCMGALSCTPHARLAMSVTGHLGPNAPPPLDGVVYVV
jgi:PncC family amidohydrolase